ncbi:type II toxin-antitoxin system VapC family toxin [Nodosilinea sp. LEGE 06152]|uniref:type II toxin-antitoxin system VapC family toxin n=1 Tax=Nodosilinea sp. LEGE 06152 TaxID=2777966 RepID=UPI00187EF147|nr:type II toxin-antitoxin system VapC family toxin [Nodosilinea sp. LEGE 06152]MBE9155943.1 type II toxin-antitoxin system VapC family toxin [Nodosilinea sp. LEGE 06152]
MSLGKVCVDASFVVRLLVVDPDESPYQALWDSWVEAGVVITAPTLILYEVTNALYRLAKAGQFSIEVAYEFLEIALGLNIELYGNANLHGRAWQITNQLSLPATYDAHYLALTEILAAELWTADRRLVNAVRDVYDWIHLVA